MTFTKQSQLFCAVVMDQDCSACQNNERNHLIGATRREYKKRNRRAVFLTLSIVVCVLLLLGVVVGLIVGIVALLNVLPDDPYDRAIALLKKNPLIDG